MHVVNKQSVDLILFEFWRLLGFEKHYGALSDSHSDNLSHHWAQNFSLLNQKSVIFLSLLNLDHLLADLLLR